MRHDFTVWNCYMGGKWQPYPVYSVGKDKGEFVSGPPERGDMMEVFVKKVHCGPAGRYPLRMNPIPQPRQVITRVPVWDTLTPGWKVFHGRQLAKREKAYVWPYEVQPAIAGWCKVIWKVWDRRDFA